MRYIIILDWQKKEECNTLKEAKKRVNLLRKIFEHSQVNILVNY